MNLALRARFSLKGGGFVGGLQELAASGRNLQFITVERERVHVTRA